MTSNHPPKELIENIFINKIKNNNIPSDKIHNYWKLARDEAYLIMQTKKIIQDAPYCIIINKIINNIYDFIIYIINIIISIILTYILLFIYCIFHSIFF